MGRGAYDTAFYERQKGGSFRAATAMLPFLIETIKPRSVVDIGCGVGPWLRAALDLGVEEVLGLDGAWVDRKKLLIPGDRFQAVDLQSGNFDLPHKFDLGLCMEVLEHLPDATGRIVVKRLCAMTSVAVVSAAIPGQGGRNHINEQWQSYWARLFAEAGFAASDAVRRNFFAREEIPYWYRQNVIVYAPAAKLQALGFAPTSPEELDVVHPELLAKYQRTLRRANARRAPITTLLNRLRAKAGRLVRG